VDFFEEVGAAGFIAEDLTGDGVDLQFAVVMDRVNLVDAFIGAKIDAVDIGGGLKILMSGAQDDIKQFFHREVLAYFAFDSFLGGGLDPVIFFFDQQQKTGYGQIKKHQRQNNTDPFVGIPK